MQTSSSRAFSQPSQRFQSPCAVIVDGNERTLVPMTMWLYLHWYNEFFDQFHNFLINVASGVCRRHGYH